MKKNKPRIALIYDRINTPYGGAENVLIALKKIYPDAPIYTSLHNPQKSKWANNFKIITSFLQKIPGAKNHHRLFAVLMPFAFESFDLSKYEIIISITSAEAKGVITRPEQLHICYLLTPPRYLYSHREETLHSRKIFSLPILKQISNLFLNYLEWWDQESMLRPDIIIPISNLVRNRVKKYYDLNTEEVIYPPINLNISGKNIHTSKTNRDINKKIKNKKPRLPETLLKNIPDNYYLIISRLVYYKRIDLVIKSCQLLSRNLVIIGDGPIEDKLKSLAKKDNNTKSKIIFMNSQPQNIVDTLYKNSTAIINPGEEDFGITTLEANSHGKPVIVFNKSGSSELIEDNIHGIHLNSQTINNMVKSVQKLETIVFDKKELLQNVEKYGTNVFMRKFENKVNTLWNKHILVLKN